MSSQTQAVSRPYLRRPRIIFACGREAGYVRNAMIARTLRANAEVTCLAGQPAASLSRNLAFLLPQLLSALRRPHDLVVLGFYSHPLVPIVRRLSRAPLLFDPFVSNYDTLVIDRGTVASTSILARMATALDKVALRQATGVLADTATHGRFYTAQFGLAPDKLSTLYVGADETVFIPRATPPAQNLVVFTYATFLPVHGLPTVVRAAKLCENHPISFRIIGAGPAAAQVQALAQQLDLHNLELLAPVPYEQLAENIAAASICLGGHFGASAKAEMVIAGKTYQFLAMAKPVIVSDTLANRELLAPHDTAAFCKRDDARALANTIIDLAGQPALRLYLGQRGRELFERQLSWEQLAKQLWAVTEQMLG